MSTDPATASAQVPRPRPPDDPPARHGVVEVTALVFRPSGRRFGWLWLVPRCPFCSTGTVSGAHAHRGARAGGIRESGCRRGVYRLRADVRGWSR